MQYFSIYYFFHTCLTNTFFITTIGESAGNELLVVIGHCQGPSSVFQHNALRTSSESVCSIALGHSELPSVRCRIQLLVVSRAACLQPPFSSTILVPLNQATKKEKIQWWNTNKIQPTETAVKQPLIKGFIFHANSHADNISQKKSITFCSFVLSLQGTAHYHEDCSKIWCRKNLQVPTLPQPQSMLQAL